MRISIGMLFVLVSATAVFAHETQVNGNTITIKCSNGGSAVGTLQGTSINFSVTYADGSQGGMSVSPSGGSPDPAVAFGDGTSIASEVCGG